MKAVFQLKDTGHGRPDFGLFTSYQFDKEGDLKGADPRPERGVGEVKGAGADLQRLTESVQVKKYLDGYGLVLVTNLREFAVVVRGPFEGRPGRRRRRVLARRDRGGVLGDGRPP